MIHQEAAPIASPQALNPPLLQVSGLSSWYGGAQVLFGLDLNIGRGEVVALMGRNGAGKSTTFKTLMGLQDKRQGHVSFMGHDISQAKPHNIARRGMAYVPENRRLFTDLTVLENLEVARQQSRFWPDGTVAPVWTVAQLFTLFPNLALMPDRMAGEMSGGEQKMLSVARSLMGNPYLVLLDEPSEGVAPLIVNQMAQMIQTLKGQGMSILLSEQNLHFAKRVADRVLVLEKGQIRYSGSVEALSADERVRREYLSV
jgi:branched-chain amino acid transport system ATP-binding protein